MTSPFANERTAQTISVAAREAAEVTLTMSPATDLTGKTLVLRVRLRTSETTPLFSVTGTAVNAAVGIFTFALSAANTDRAFGQYQFDVWNTTDSQRLAYGVLSLLPSIPTSA